MYRSYPATERVYVTVASSFDTTGYMQPTAITWTDGVHSPLNV